MPSPQRSSLETIPTEDPGRYPLRGYLESPPSRPAMNRRARNDAALEQKGEKHMKLIPWLSILGLLALGTSLAADDGGSGNFTGTYLASLPLRAEILQLHQDGT